MSRRIPGLLIVLAAIAGLVAFTRQTPAPAVAQFSATVNGWMPAAPPPGGLIETWFCPGVPATGLDGVEGSVVVANRGDQQLVGTVLVLNDAGESRRLELTVEPWTSATLDLDATLPGSVVGAVVEIEGGGAIVEEQSFHPDGNSSAACANATSDNWYLADGFTVDGSLDQVVLTNPFEQTVVANVTFATREGFREPASYRGLTVPPRSIRVIDLGAPGAGAQSEPVLAVHVEAARGRLVVGRFQQFLGGGRAGTQVSVAASVTREQWWFADGAKGPDVDEQFVIYNPTSESVEVDVVFIGIEAPVLVDPIVVPAREAVVFDTALQLDLPEGRHATVFATSTNEPSIVVDRVLTTDDGEVVGTSVLTGALSKDGFISSVWYSPSGPSEPVTSGLAVYNVTNDPGTVSVFAIGSSGPVAVEGLQDVPYQPAQRIEIDLTDPLVVGRQLVIQATTGILVEQSFPNGVGGLRTSSWAIPAAPVEAG